MPSDFDVLMKEVEKGILDKNEGIPLHLPKLGNYLSIRKNVYTLLGAGGGVGKTSFVDSAFVLEPYQWLLDNKGKTDIKAEWVYRSQERNKTTKLAKWACYKIWKDFGVLITPAELLGWKKDKITDTQKGYLDSTREFFETMQDSKIITIIDGQENPRGIFLHLEKYALERGEEEKISEFEKVYHPNDENLIVIPVIDTIGKCKLETVDGSKNRKTTSDKCSEYMSIVRDRFGMSPIVISHFNRNIKSEVYNKQQDPEPTQESFRDTSQLYDDSDLALSLHNPYKFKTMDYSGYEIPKFVNKETGANYFRSLKILKSSYSEDDLRFSMGFLGHIGMYKHLEKANDIRMMGENDRELLYDRITKNHDWFLPEAEKPQYRDNPRAGIRTTLSE